MKVLFYSHTGKVSGAEFVLLTIIEKLDRSKIEPSAVCPGEGGLAERFSGLGLEVSDVPELQARFTVRPDRLLSYAVSAVEVVRQLRRAVIIQSPEAVHANSVRAGLIAFISTIGLGTPVTWHLQDELPRHPISTFIRLVVASSRRNRLMAASEATLKSFCGRLSGFIRRRNDTSVVHNGVDLSRFEGDGEAGEQIRDSLGICRDEMVFGTIGQITPRKGQSGLIEAFAAVQDRLPKSRLLIAGRPMFNGDDEYLREIKELVTWHGLEGKVIFLGQRSDIPDVLKAMDALVVNSKSEALVVVAIEAMASGTPVIATDVGGTRELVRHLENGWLLNYGDKPALEEALVRVGTEPAARIAFAKEAFQTVRNGFSSHRLAADAERFILAAGKVGENPVTTASAVGRLAEGR